MDIGVPSMKDSKTVNHGGHIVCHFTRIALCKVIQHFGCVVHTHYRWAMPFAQVDISIPTCFNASINLIFSLIRDIVKNMAKGGRSYGGKLQKTVPSYD